MENNVAVALFEVESEAYQALAQIRQYPGGETSYVPAAALVKKENGVLHTLDGFDTGANTADDTALGGLVGALFGVLGGPVGVLLGGAYGALIGSVLDTDDALMNASMLEQIMAKMEEGEVAIIALAYEENEEVLDQRLAGFATVGEEVEEAHLMEKEMARQARKELRDEKKADRKEKRAEKKAKLSADWEGFKAKFKKD